MSIFGLIYTFILGTIIGSFLNVVALRYNTGRGVSGRSFCFSCGHKLSWFELLPVVSFFALRGRCRSCKSKISWQYVLVEIFTGVIFAGLFYKLQYLLFFGQYTTYALEYCYYAVMFSLLIVILVYDWKHKIIPDGLVYAFGVLAIIHLYPFVTVSPFDLAAGVLLFLPFYFLWLVSSGRWIGLGDGKLALGMGWMLGLVDGIGAVVLSFWLGALFALIALFLQKRKLTMKSEIPFAPFLIAGTILIFFFRFDVVGLKALLSLAY